MLNPGEVSAPHPIPQDWSGYPTHCLRHKKRFYAHWNCISVCGFSHCRKAAVTQEKIALDVSKTCSSIIQGVWTVIELLQKNCLYCQPRWFQVTVIPTHLLCLFCPQIGYISDIMCPTLPHMLQGSTLLSLAYPWVCETCPTGGRTQAVPTGWCLSSSCLFPRGISSDQCFWVGKLTQVSSYAGFRNEAVS